MRDLNIPEKFPRERAAAGLDRIDYGVGGIVLLDPSELAEGQIGYSVTLDGTTLVGGGDGDWHFDWLVIGYEHACGDPIFMSGLCPYFANTASIFPRSFLDSGSASNMVSPKSVT
jgi:hypothetical protein